MFSIVRGLLSVGAVARLRRNQFRNTDQIVGDQIEHEVGGDATDAAMFCLALPTVLFAPAEDAFDHRAARLRLTITFVSRGACVDGALATFAGLGEAIILCPM